MVRTPLARERRRTDAGGPEVVGRDAEQPGPFTQLRVGQQRHGRTGEEVGHDEVQHGRQAEVEREPADRPDRQEVEHRGADQRREVGLEDRAVGVRERLVGSRLEAAALSDVLLQVLVEHHARIEGHPDRHDDADDARQRQREALRRAEEADHDPHRHARHQQRPEGHEPEEPVVGDDVEDHQPEADGPGDQRRLERTLAEGGGHRLDLLGLHRDGQRAVAERRGQVVGRVGRRSCPRSGSGRGRSSAARSTGPR